MLHFLKTKLFKLNSRAKHKEGDVKGELKQEVRNQSS